MKGQVGKWSPLGVQDALDAWRAVRRAKWSPSGSWRSVGRAKRSPSGASEGAFEGEGLQKEPSRALRRRYEGLHKEPSRAKAFRRRALQVYLESKCT